LDKLDKSLIKQRFARSLLTYSDNALVQRETAERLMYELRSAAGNDFDRIFEIGCGSGLLTQMIAEQLKFNQFYLNDLVDECETVAAGITNCQFIPGDVERLPELPEKLDLVISNATFQWLDHLPDILARLDAVMAEGSVLAFSTFGPQNAREIAELKQTSLNYLTPPQLKSIVAERFNLICFHENIRQIKFAHPMDVLNHLKNTGVTAVSKDIWTKSVLKKFIANYIDRYGSEHGVTLTYHPVMVIAEKK